MIKIKTVDGVPITDMAWNPKEYGTPTYPNLKEWVNRYNASIDPDGCNSHLPIGSKVKSAMIKVNGTEELDGQKSVSGSIVVLRGEKYLFGKENLVLSMQDGRRIKFFVKEGLSGEFEIQPSGSFY